MLKGLMAAPGRSSPNLFFISSNSSVNPLVPSLEQPGGLNSPGDGKFSPASLTPFPPGRHFPTQWPACGDCRGEAIFNSRPIDITGVAGINDHVTSGGLVARGLCL